MSNSPKTHRRSLGVWPLLALLALVACGGGSAGGGAPAAADDPVPEPAPTPAAESTFDRIQEQVFSRSCASESCHSSAGRAGDLVLEPGVSYDALIDVTPAHRAAAEQGLLRVHPGDPDASLLCHKIEDGLAADLGIPMPYGGAPLDTHTTEVVRAWILAGAPRTGRVPGDDGGPLGTETDDGELTLDPPSAGLQLDVTARELPLGTEETRCHTFKLASDMDLEVNRFEIAVSGGSHHIHLYRAYDQTMALPDESFDCNYTVDFDQWELVAAAQLARTDWQLPKGVAFRFRAGEQLLMQTHFVNVGGLETSGQPRVLVNLHAIPEDDVVAHAGSIFGQDRDVLVPANAISTRSGGCTFPNATTIMAMTGHYHYRGRHFETVRLADDGTEIRPPLYIHEGYEDPLFETYPPAMSPEFAAGESLRWTCTYDNRDDRDYEFGPFTDRNEHCNLFAFYYPTQTETESTTCIVEDGVITTTVRGTGALE